MHAPFRWIGNKVKLMDDGHFGTPQFDFKRIVEPYAGSMIYSMNTAKSHHYITGFEIDENALGIWDWLSKTTDAELDRLRKMYSELPQNGYSLSECTECEEIKNYLSLGGALLPVFRNKIYPGMKHPNWEKTKGCLPIIQSNKFTIVNGSCHDLYESTTGDMMFVDPPYFGSGSMYDLGEDDYRPSMTIDMIDRSNVPTILTYGDFAPEHFPCYNWDLLCELTLIKPKKGSSRRTRKEWVSWVNIDRNSFFNTLESFLE